MSDSGSTFFLLCAVLSKLHISAESSVLSYEAASKTDISLESLVFSESDVCPGSLTADFDSTQPMIALVQEQREGRKMDSAGVEREIKFNQSVVR